MSEKKSNGQVPEEGPDGKNLEQSEKKESFAFLEETIKPKKISRQQGMKQLIRIAICGLVLGGFACLGFFGFIVSSRNAKDSFFSDCSKFFPSGPSSGT